MPDPTVCALGVDPGMALTGLAVVSVSYQANPVPTCYRLEDACVWQTTKDPSKKIRASQDEQRRMRRIWETAVAWIRLYCPTVIGVEQWRPFPGQMGGNAWKVGLVAQLIQCAGWSVGDTPSALIQPGDLKRRFLAKSGGTKTEIETAVLSEVAGVGAKLAVIPKSKHEHICDAVALAVVALESWNARERATKQ